MSRDGLRSFTELLAETQHDEYAGNLTPVYDVFTPDMTNVRTQAQLLTAAANNPNFVAYAIFSTGNQLQLIYHLTTVAAAIGPGASRHAGSTLAIMGELGELTGPALVTVEETHFGRAPAAFAPTLAHYDALLAAEGENPEYLYHPGAAADANHTETSARYACPVPNDIGALILSHPGMTPRQAYEVVGGALRALPNPDRNRLVLDWLRV